MTTNWLRAGVAGIVLAGFAGTWGYIRSVDDASAPQAETVSTLAGAVTAAGATPPASPTPASPSSAATSAAAAASTTPTATATARATAAPATAPGARTSRGS